MDSPGGKGLLLNLTYFKVDLSSAFISEIKSLLGPAALSQ
jgi:hypothetical protein